MKKNNKGFTLVELLAVIVIISIVSTIAGTGVIAIRKAINENLLDSKIDIIESGAVLWGQDNMVILTKTSSTCNGETGLEKKVSDLDAYVEGSDTCEKEQINSTTGVKETVSYTCIQNNASSADMSDDLVCIYVKNNRVYALYYEDNVSTNK